MAARRSRAGQWARAIRGQVGHVRIFAIFRNFDGCVRPGFKRSMNAFSPGAGNSTYGRDIRFRATKSVADRLQAPVFEVYPVLCRWAVSDANGACSDAKLFICSPHSCEVV